MFRNMNAQVEQKQVDRMSSLIASVDPDESFGVTKVQLVLRVGYHTAEKIIKDGLESSTLTKDTKKPWLVKLN